MLSQDSDTSRIRRANHAGRLLVLQKWFQKCVHASLSLSLCLLDTWTRSRGREDYRKGHAVLVDSFGPSRQPWAVLATPPTLLLGTAKNSTWPFLRRPPSVLDLWKPELLDWAGVTGFHAARVWNIHVTRGLKGERHRSVVSYCMILCLLGEVLQD